MSGSFEKPRGMIVKIKNILRIGCLSPDWLVVKVVAHVSCKEQSAGRGKHLGLNRISHDVVVIFLDAICSGGPYTLPLIVISVSHNNIGILSACDLGLLTRIPTGIIFPEGDSS